MILIVTHFNCFKMLEKWERIRKNITTISKSITQTTTTTIWEYVHILSMRTFKKELNLYTI